MTRSIALFMCMVLFLCGCTSSDLTPVTAEENISESSGLTTDEQGNRFSENSKGTSAFAKQLPCTIQHNGADISLVSVSTYQVHSETHHNYHLFIVAELDVSALDDDQIYWLRDSDLTCMATVTHEKNECERERIDKLGDVLVEDTKTLFVVFSSSEFKSYRHDFSNSNLHIFFFLDQEEKYSNDSGTEYQKQNSISYNWDIGNEIPDANEIPRFLQEFITKWQGNKTDFFSSIS